MIELNDITVRFGTNTVLEHFSLTIPDGARVALMGPSGSGKSTVLKLIAGQLKPTSGTVKTDARKISYMFQEPRLLPWLTAAENVNLVLGDSPETLPLACGWLSRVGLSGAENKLPAELSGGMRQRVALARALAYNGDLFLFDEPLSSLDSALSKDMLALIRQYTGGKTVVFVTHSFEQAKQIADSIYVLKNKRTEPM